MKLSQIEELKKKVKEHQKDYETSDKGRENEYRALKRQILERIDLLEQIKDKERKYLADIQEYVDRLRNRLKVDLLGVDVGKRSEEREPEAEAVREPAGEKGLEDGSGPSPV